MELTWLTLPIWPYVVGHITAFDSTQNRQCSILPHKGMLKEAGTHNSLTVLVQVVGAQRCTEELMMEDDAGYRQVPQLLMQAVPFRTQEKCMLWNFWY